MFKYSLRNIFRYKLRSGLTLLVIIVSSFASVLSMGFYQGIVDLFMDGFISFQTGHIRISTQEFLENKRFMPVHEYIEETEKVTEELAKNPAIDKVIRTYKTFGLLGNGNSTQQVSIVGLDFLTNSYRFDENMIQGFVSQEGMLIGESFRQKLGAELGTELLISASKTDGGLGGIKIPIVGTYNYGIKNFDLKTVFMDLDNIQKLLRSGEVVTEIYVLLNNINQVDRVKKEIQEQFPDLAIESYKDQMGAIYILLEIQKYIIGMITAFVMFLGSLIIVNSLLASIYERMNEIGMMKAIGFTDKDLAQMFFFEGGIFGVCGGIIGFILGLSFIGYFHVNGLNITAITSQTNLPMSSTLYLSISMLNSIVSLITVVIVPALVALIPAQHIKNITPIFALNSTH